MNSDPVPAITEAAATGATAELFADIRDVVGVRVVNLVWRHLATLEGGLPLAWAAVRPLYVEGIVDIAARAFRSDMRVPRLASLAGGESPGIHDVLVSYDHSNTINLFALGALLACLRGQAEPGASAGGEPARGPRMQAPGLALPALLSESEVAPDTWARVLRLNRYGERGEPQILASMYRHLAHWPAFLERLEAALAAAQDDGTLEAAISANRAEAGRRARLLARAISLPPIPPELRPGIEAAVALFVEHAIGKMVTIGRAVLQARETAG